MFTEAPGGPPRYTPMTDGPVQYLTISDRDGEVIGYVWANDEDDAADWEGVQLPGHLYQLPGGPSDLSGRQDFERLMRHLKGA